MSGIIALTRDLQALGESLDIFSERIETGGASRLDRRRCRGQGRCLRRSTAAAGHMAQALRAAAAKVAGRRLDGRRKGLPYITVRHTPEESWRR